MSRCNTTPKVMLWSPLRCASTAFERSIRTLRNGKIFHVPFFKVYSQASHSSNSNSHLTRMLNLKFNDITDQLSKEYDDIEFIFGKDHPMFLMGKYEIVLDGLEGFQHTFLIRNPRDAISSLYRAAKNNLEVAQHWHHFDPDNAGFRAVRELYDFVVRKLNISPVVLDAGDLLEYPDEIMRLYCELTNLPHKENMTSWEPDIIDDWKECYDKLHNTVARSSGFERKVKSKDDPSVQPEHDLVRQAIKESMPHYNALYERRIGVF